MTLVTGESYVVSFFNASFNGDWFYCEFNPPATMMVDPAITYVQGRWNDATGLEMPPIPGAPALRIGPNFLFNEGTPAIQAARYPPCSFSF